MRIHLAGIASDKAKVLAQSLGVRNFLLSFVSGAAAFKLHEDTLRSKDCTFLVDSGAFSVWTKGAKIEIDKYAEFARKLRDDSSCEINFVNLDVIPGRSGKRPTHAEREDAARQSFENFCYLKKTHGLETLNVFHQHEDFEDLARIDDNAIYYGVSPANDVSAVERERWLGRVFEFVAGRHQTGGIPKTHGFGITKTDMLKKFPFFSVDSTTWMNGAKYATFIAYLRDDQNLIQIQRENQFPDNAEYTAADIVRFSEDLSARYEIGIRAFVEFEMALTEIWEARGLTWDLPVLAAPKKPAKKRALPPKKVPMAGTEATVSKVEVVDRNAAIFAEIDRLILDKLASVGLDLSKKIKELIKGPK